MNNNNNFSSMHLPPIDLGAATTLEAVLAAVEVCRNQVLRSTKTPVGLVQEMCMKMRIAPTYDSDIKAGLSHKPTFVCTAAMGQFRAVAEGPNKKRAKHLSAVELLKELRAGAYSFGNEPLGKLLDELVSLVAQMKENEEIDEQERLFKQNVLGELIELTLKNNLVAPLIQEEGQLADGRFVYSGKLQDYEDMGYGPSKKEAKRDVATKLMTYLKKKLGATAVLRSPHHLHQRNSVSFNDDATMNGADSSALTSNLNSTDARELTDNNLFYHLVNSKKPSTTFLFSHGPDKIPNLNDFTLALLKEEDLQYQYDMEFHDGLKGTVLEMSLRVETRPQPIVFIGYGGTKDEGILKANLQFLSYLKTLCSRKKETQFA